MDIKAMLCFHPHGILGAGFTWNGIHSNELGHKATFLAVDMLCYVPVFAWILKWCGNVQGAGAANMTRLMKQGKNIALLPGGFEEATIHK